MTPVVVDNPVTLSAPLLGTPLAVGEPIRIQVQLNGDNKVVDFLSKSSAISHNLYPLKTQIQNENHNVNPPIG
jgi:hypothetical protein